MKKNKKINDNSDKKSETEINNEIQDDKKENSAKISDAADENISDANETNEINDLKDQLLRSLAENENLRKRTSKDIDQIKKFGHMSLIRDFLNIVDNLDRAVKSSFRDDEKLTTDVKNLMIGVEIVLKEMNILLEKNYIKKIDPLHEKFDYNFHQAMFEAHSDDHEEGIITEVVQSGYTLHDRLVRPAMVGVSKGKGDNPNEKKE